MINRTIKLAVLLLVTLQIAAAADTDVGFSYFNEDAESIDLVGNFGPRGRIVFLPMLKISDYHWTLSLNLDYGIYHYKYHIDKKYWKLDEFIDETVSVHSGPVQGKFTALKIKPRRALSLNGQRWSGLKGQKKWILISSGVPIPTNASLI